MKRWIAGWALLSAMAAVAQGAPPVAAAAAAYDLVSTVKPNPAVEVHLRIRMDAGEIFIQDASLKDLLSNVYGLRGSLIFNLPKWAENDRFDIRAKVLSDDPSLLQHMTRTQRREVFERLLRERFGLLTHVETREMPIYDLVRVGPGKQLIDNPPPPPSSEPVALKPGKNGRGNTDLFPGHLEATGVRMADFCANLAGVLDRSVVDKTGLTSFYDITLNWSDERSDSTASDEPSLFAALQEQLGLKLEPAKGPVRVVIVDTASPPNATDK